MQKWEYAQLEWLVGPGSRRSVEFTHSKKWEPLGDGLAMFWATLRRLGEEGWEMVHAGGSFWFKRPLP